MLSSIPIRILRKKCGTGFIVTLRFSLLANLMPLKNRMPICVKKLRQKYPPKRPSQYMGAP